eukprot:979546-Pleurochrysis_carterae.AAC.1
MMAGVITRIGAEPKKVAAELAELMAQPWKKGREHRGNHVVNSLEKIAKLGVEYFFTEDDVEACEKEGQALEDLVKLATSEWKALVRLGKYLRDGIMKEHDVAAD